MSDYELYYWPIPFRGQFIRALLAFAGKSWSEHSGAEILALREAANADKPIPFMGPPVLIDNATGVALAQMPAIALYLGETLNLLPADPAARALTMKIVQDANDVLDDITLDGGRLMWTQKRWEAFLPRLRKWMSFWEENGRRHGLKARSGFLLGGEAPGIADIVTAVLWSTMGDRFPALAALLKEEAPKTAALTKRIAVSPPLAALAETAKAHWGEVYCGGQIEASLRKVLEA